MERASHDMARAFGRKRASCGGGRPVRRGFGITRSGWGPGRGQIRQEPCDEEPTAEQAGVLRVEDGHSERSAVRARRRGQPRPTGEPTGTWWSLVMARRPSCTVCMATATGWQRPCGLVDDRYISGEGDAGFSAPWTEGWFVGASPNIRRLEHGCTGPSTNSSDFRSSR